MKRLLLMSLATLPALGVDLDHARWDSLVKKYVTSESRVDYQSIKQHGLGDLDAYLKQIAVSWPPGMSARETKAALINAYNALTIRWIVTNYPQKSIWRTENPFRKPRHTLDGKLVSLDQVETRLREMKDPRVHAALVCAARSCPPLRREAYTAASLETQLDDNARRWLADKRFNQFTPDKKTARVSEIFKWYAKDFGGTGGVKDFLARYGPDAAFIDTRGARLEYEPYFWGLNDISTLGSDYTQWDFYKDQLRLGLTGR